METVLLKLTTSLEEHMVSRGYDPERLQMINYMFAIKLVDWKQDRYTVFEVIEDLSTPNEFTVRARSNFKSYSNCMLILNQQTRNRLSLTQECFQSKLQAFGRYSA